MSIFWLLSMSWAIFSRKFRHLAALKYKDEANVDYVGRWQEESIEIQKSTHQIEMETKPYADGLYILK